MMQVYALESSLLRAKKIGAGGAKSQAATAEAMVRLFAADALAIADRAGKRVLAAVAEGDMLRTQMAILRRLTKHEPANTIALGRVVAQRMLDAAQYRL
jgi:hypothetical protein